MNSSSRSQPKTTPKSADTEAQPSALEDLTDRFTYLDDLRESGETNMFGAGQYLELFMGCARHEARAVLSQWMDTFDRETTPAERAAKALGFSAQDTSHASDEVPGRNP